MKKLLFFCFALVFLSSKCKEDSTPKMGKIALEFKPFFKDTALIINKVYNLAGRNTKFTRISFFISDENGNGSTQMLDFSDRTDSIKAVGYKKITVEGLDEGDFANFSMGLGVLKASNAKKPADFNSSNPLSEGTEYWEDWKSYIFVKIEGFTDRDNNGSAETAFTLHTGSDDAYRTLNFTKNYSVNANGTTSLQFDIKVDKILQNIDLQTVTSVHQTAQKTLMLQMMDDLKNAITIK